jgi:hypothetical protein
VIGWKYSYSVRRGDAACTSLLLPKCIRELPLGRTITLLEDNFKMGLSEIL